MREEGDEGDKTDQRTQAQAREGLEWLKKNEGQKQRTTIGTIGANIVDDDEEEDNDDGASCIYAMLVSLARHGMCGHVLAMHFLADIPTTC